MVRDMVEDSYDLVVASLSRANRNSWAGRGWQAGEG